MNGVIANDMAAPQRLAQELAGLVRSPAFAHKADAVHEEDGFDTVLVERIQHLGRGIQAGPSSKVNSTS